MGTKDPRVDAYIESANPFARPILAKLRKWTHQYLPRVRGDPEVVRRRTSHTREDVLRMSAFKEHCAFGFWHPLMRKDDNSLEGMGSYGKIRSLADLPKEGEFARRARAAMKLTDEGVKAPPKPKRERAPLRVPADLKAALTKNGKARAAYDEFTVQPQEGIHRLDHGSEARGDARGAPEAGDRMDGGGKSRHWKYTG
jgi:hypothetical protein